MATNKGKGSDSSAKTKADKGTEKVKQISRSSSQIVQDAAALLDDEMAAGIVAAKQVQQRFQRERRIDPKDFNEALTKLQGQAHEMINQLNSKLSGAGSKENEELLKRFVDNSHTLLDLTVELINTGAEIADQLAQSNVPKK